MFFNCRVLSAVKIFLPDTVVNKSRQASNEKFKRSSSSVATQSVKRLKGKLQGVIRCSCHINLFSPGAVVNKSRQASNKEVNRSSFSVAAQSVKRLSPLAFCYL